MPWNREGKIKEMTLEEYSNTDIQIAINEWIRNERNRNILKQRLIDGVCYEPLAEEMDMSVRQIKTIVYRETEKLIKHL